MSSMFKVQEGVPLPEIDRKPKQPRRKYPIEGMKIDAMFFVPGRTVKSVSAYISRISKGVPGKFSTRHVWMRNKSPAGSLPEWEICKPHDDGAVEGVGVWRIE